MGNSPSKYKNKDFFLSCKTQPQLLDSLEKESTFMSEIYSSNYQKLHHARHKGAGRSAADMELYERGQTLDFNGYVKRTKNILNLKKLSDDEVKDIAGILSCFFCSQPWDGETEKIAKWCNKYGEGLEEDEMTKKYLNFFQKMDKVEDVLQSLDKVIGELEPNYDEIFFRMNEGVIEKTKLKEMLPKEKSYFLLNLKNVRKVITKRKNSYEGEILNQIERFLDHYIAGHMSRVSRLNEEGRRNIENFIQHWRSEGVEMD